MVKVISQRVDCMVEVEVEVDCMFTILVQQYYFLRQWSENTLKGITSCKPHIDRNIGVERGKM